MFRKTFWGAVGTALVVGVVAVAGTGSGARVLTGKLVCLPCTLHAQKNAAAQCGKYGHKYVLQIEDGKFWPFLENNRSEPLMKGGAFVNQTVKVYGKTYPEAQAVEGESFEVGGKNTPGVRCVSQWLRHTSTEIALPARKLDDAMMAADLPLLAGWRTWFWERFLRCSKQNGVPFSGGASKMARIWVVVLYLIVAPNPTGGHCYRLHLQSNLLYRHGQPLVRRRHPRAERCDPGGAQHGLACFFRAGSRAWARICR